MLGRSGTPVASWLMNESDLLLVVGASFANHTGIAPYKPIVQIDDTPSAIGRFNPVDVGVLGDAAVTLRPTPRTAGRRRAPSTSGPDVAARWAIWRAEKARRAADDRGRGVASAAVFAALGRHCPADAVIAVDVGNHAYSFGRYFESAGQPVLMSGYLGSIGFGYPAAMGAWAADPARPVVAVTGDGGFGQYLAELTTAVKYGIPVKHVLLDNGALGKISKEQLAGAATRSGRPRWSTPTSPRTPGSAEPSASRSTATPTSTPRWASSSRRQDRRCCTSTPTASWSEHDGRRVGVPGSGRRQSRSAGLSTTGSAWDGGRPDRGSAHDERLQRGVDRQLIGGARRLQWMTTPVAPSTVLPTIIFQLPRWSRTTSRSGRNR